MTTTTEAETGGESESETKTTGTDTGTGADSPSETSATIAELSIPVAEFALGETIAALDGAAFEIERIVAHDADRLMPFVWVSGSESAAIERALDDDPSVDEFDLLADVGNEGDGENEYLYRMEWADRIEVLVHLLVDEGATVLAAATANGRWNLRLLVPERAVLSRTHDVCEQVGLTMDVVKIYELDEGRQGRFGLTDEQQEALLFAFENGYYEVPRRMMAQEFAADLGISHQALSERLRRAHGNLVENAIIIGFE